jgi:predicted DNA-binding transcriptional regulator YafY
MSTKLERILRMDGVIRSGNYPSVKTFIENFEVSERTVLSDVEFLKNRFYAPLAYSRSHRGYFYTDKDWKLPTLPVTEGQLLALFLSVELTERYLGTGFEQPLRNAIQQIIELLPRDVQVSMNELANHYSIRPGASAKTSPETLLALQQAIQSRHPVDMVYFTASRGEDNQRVVYPYHLLNIRGEWNLIAYDLLRQSIRQFALPRIRTWRILSDEQFEFDATFSPEDYFRESFQAEHGDQIVEVVLHFDAYQARYMRERSLHSSQETKDEDDGSMLMLFKTGALAEVQRQIMSYGKHVKVLEPESLAAAIVDELRAALQLYGSSS